MLLDRHINYITFTVRNCASFFHEGESEGGKTKGNDAYRLPACHVSKKWRCVFIGAVHERELTRLNTSAELTGTLTLHDDYD